MMNRRWLLAAIAAVLTAQARAGSVGGIGGATEFTQIANNIQLAQQYAQQLSAYTMQLQQYATQITQLRNQVQNTMMLPQQIWGQVEADLRRVASLVQDGQSLAFATSGINDRFKQVFKGYQTGPVDYKTEYKRWSSTTLDSLRSALNAANYQAEQFDTEEGLLRGLRDASMSADGQLKALQVGAQIAEQQAQQLQKLRALMMAQMQSQNAYMAAQANKDATIRGAVDAAAQYRDPRVTGQRFKGGTL